MDSVYGPVVPRGGNRNGPYNKLPSNAQATNKNLLEFLENIDYSLNVIKMMYTTSFSPPLSACGHGVHSEPDPRW